VKRSVNWRGYGTLRYGTWNVRRLNGKELELVRSEGRRPKGGRRVIWVDNIQLSLKERKRTWREAVVRAQDRAAWRTLFSLYTVR
jgi:hypothetical protein